MKRIILSFFILFLLIESALNNQIILAQAKYNNIINYPLWSNVKKSFVTNQTKQGGICFRTDDDQDIYKYLDYATLFNKYDQKFSFAINLSTVVITPDYIAGLKQLQADGHEMMDHTPYHRTNYFRTPLSTDMLFK